MLTNFLLINEEGSSKKMHERSQTVPSFRCRDRLTEQDLLHNAHIERK
jgi:hypothetical protein